MKTKNKKSNINILSKVPIIVNRGVVGIALLSAIVLFGVKNSSKISYNQSSAASESLNMVCTVDNYKPSITKPAGSDGSVLLTINSQNNPGLKGKIKIVQASPNANLKFRSHDPKILQPDMDVNSGQNFFIDYTKLPKGENILSLTGTLGTRNTKCSVKLIGASDPIAPPAELIMNLKLDGDITDSIDPKLNTQGVVISNSFVSNPGFNRALNTATGAHIKITTAPKLTPKSGRISFGGWIKSNEVSESKWQSVLMRVDSTYHRRGGYGMYLQKKSEGGKLCAFVYIWSSGVCADIGKDSTWKHVMFTFDGKVQKLFLNGSEISSRALPTSAVSYGFGTSNLWIGADASNKDETQTYGDDYWSGILDEIRIYDGTLSANEIKNLSIAPTKKNTGISYYKESTRGELLYLRDISKPEGYWDYNRFELLNRFYNDYQDEFDFLIVFPMKPLESNNSLTINLDIEGIGHPTTHLSGSTKRLKSLISMDLYSNYLTQRNIGSLQTQSLLNLFARTAVHEIGHHWCCHINTPVMTGAHYPTTIDLFNNDKTLSDPMGYSRWITNSDGSHFCVDHNRQDAVYKFSKLSLYLMGLEQKSKVPPMRYSNYKKNNDYSHVGPYCDSKVEWLSTTTYTIEDVIKVAGVRVPAYPATEKDFNVGYVIVGDINSQEDKEFLELVKLFGETLSKQWSGATSNLSSLKNKY